MRQFTNESQTAKLIELGFEKPEDDWFDMNYSIGELMEILDKYQDKLSMVKTEYRWYVNYHTKNIEPIDALYDMIVKLKEDGEI